MSFNGVVLVVLPSLLKVPLQLLQERGMLDLSEVRKIRDEVREEISVLDLLSKLRVVDLVEVEWVDPIDVVPSDHFIEVGSLLLEALLFIEGMVLGIVGLLNFLLLSLQIGWLLVVEGGVDELILEVVDDLVLLLVVGAIELLKHASKLHSLGIDVIVAILVQIFLDQLLSRFGDIMLLSLERVKYGEV